MDQPVNLPSILDPKRKAGQCKNFSWNMHRSIHDTHNQWMALKYLLMNDTVESGPYFEIAAIQHCDTFLKEMKTVYHQAKNPDSEGTINVDHVVDFDKRSESDEGPYLTKCIDKNHASSREHYIDVREFKWDLKNNTFYIYHLYTRSMVEKVGRYAKVNLAIVSCYRAHEVFVFQQTKNDDKPILGIRIDTRFFFNIDVRPLSPPIVKILANIHLKIITNTERKTENQEIVSWVMCGSCTRQYELDEPRLHYIARKVLYEKVHHFHEEYTFALVGDNKIMLDNYLRRLIPGIRDSMYCTVLNVDRAYLKAVGFFT